MISNEADIVLEQETLLSFDRFDSEAEKYEDCFVAYMDVLGFKALISENAESPAKVSQLYTTFRKPMESAHLIVPEMEDIKISFTDVNWRIMSDSVFGYIEVSKPDSLLKLLLCCTEFQARLARLDVPLLVRGSITRGNLYAKDDILFGPALVQAYIMESESAKTPRIILTEDTWKKYKFDSEIKSDVMLRWIMEDDDKLWVLRYCKRLYTTQLSDFHKFRNYVCERLAYETHRSIREKYIYVFEKLEIVSNEDPKIG